MIKLMRVVSVGFASVFLTCLLFVCSPEISVAQENSAGENAIPFKKQEAPPSGSIARTILVSILLLGGVAGAGILLRRNLQKKGVITIGDGKRIALAERKRLSPKITAFLLDVDGQDYLLVQSGDNLQIVRHEKRSGGTPE